MQDMTEKERKDSQMAILYELRLLFTQSEKEQYTRGMRWLNGGKYAKA